MKATIDKHGSLKVCAETELEQYALQKWADENYPDPDFKGLLQPKDLPNVTICWGDPDDDA